MSENISLDDYEFDEYTKQQMLSIAKELDLLQTSYDTRLLAALLAGRAASLHAMLVATGNQTKEQARAVWDHAGQVIDNPPDREIKTMSMMDGQIFDPSKAN